MWKKTGTIKKKLKNLKLEDYDYDGWVTEEELYDENDIRWN